MKQAYWDRVAENYENELFDVLSNDKKQLIAKHIRRYGKGKKLAVDLGCGSGRFLPLLSRTLQEVVAIDLSSNCLRLATQANQRLDNVTYHKADLATKGLDIRKTDLALSVASIMMPDIALRNRVYDNITRQLKRGAHFILVVPSMESAMFTHSRLIEWNLKQGSSPRRASRDRFEGHTKDDVLRHREGVARVDGIPTKHYLREELIVLLEKRKMRILEIEKLEYDWNTEFARPPRWMQAPGPWDWLVVSQRTG